MTRESFFQTGLSAVFADEQTLSKPLTIIIGLLAIFMVVFHIIQTLQLIVPSGQLKNIHLGISLVIAFLILANKKTNGHSNKNLIWILLALLALVPLTYIHFEYEQLVGSRALFSTITDLTIGIVLLSLTLIAATAQWGLIIP